MSRSALSLWSLVASLISALGSPAYEIYLTQNGSSQFAEFEVSVPPLREFTFCVWLKTMDLTQDQAIFTYLVNSKALISLWLESGGGNLHSKLGSAEFIAPVNWARDQWQHLCMSWQSDSGSWALYQDGKILNCEASDKVIHNVIPGGGKILLGVEDIAGGLSGWEGEFHDFVMILASIMERNNDFQSVNHFIKMPNKNTLGSYMKKLIEKLETDNTSEVSNIKNEFIQPKRHSHVVFRTPFSYVEHDVGIHLEMPSSAIHGAIEKPPKIVLPKLNEPEFLDMRSFNRDSSIPSKTMSKLWNIINKAGQTGKFKSRQITSAEQFETGTDHLPILSEFETPPPPNKPMPFEIPTNDFTEIKPPLQDQSKHFHLSDRGISMNKQPSEKKYLQNMKHTALTIEPLPTLYDMEKPPSPEDDNKVYGHWTGETFANSVLGFLKNNHYNFRNVPKTITLKKVSDTYPYASDNKIVTTVPLGMGFSIKHTLPNSLSIIKRYVRSPEINLKIVNENIRQYISRQHAKEQAVNVEVHPRGEIFNGFEEETPYKWYDKIIMKPHSHRQSNITNHKTDEERPTVSQIRSIEPNYFKKVLTSNENRLNNLQKFNNEFINIDSHNRKKYKQHIEDNVFSDNLNLPSLPRLSFQLSPHNLKLLEFNQDKSFDDERWRKANGENSFGTPIAINLKYDFVNTTKGKNIINKENSNKRENTFYKAVKLGNALNERLIIGNGDDDKKKSFVGGDDKIPDIQRYRSEIDNSGRDRTGGTPPSLRAIICERAAHFANRLNDQSEGKTYFSQSSDIIDNKTDGIKFLLEHFNGKCEKGNYSTQHKSVFLVRWKETPVRLYGGAKIMRVSDLCDQFN